MPRMIIAFLIFWLLSVGVYTATLGSNGKQKLTAMKYMMHTGVTALIATAALFVIVQLF